jgi:hypothetical protein
MISLLHKSRLASLFFHEILGSSEWAFFFFLPLFPPGVLVGAIVVLFFSSLFFGFCGSWSAFARCVEVRANSEHS